jgi:hypothetical protein
MKVRGDVVGLFKQLNFVIKSNLEQFAEEGDSPVWETKKVVDKFKSNIHRILNVNTGAINP